MNMDISTTLIVIILLSIPVSWYEARTYKQVIKAWREQEPNTYSKAGSPTEYLALYNLKIKYSFILNFDYKRLVNNLELLALFKRHHAILALEHVLLITLLLCAIYC